MLPSGEIEYYKVILLGNQNVGKTSLINRWVNNKFDNDLSPTIGSSNYFAQVDDYESPIPVSVWDTAGQEQFRAIIPQYIRNSKCAIIVVAANNIESIEAIDSWIEEVSQVVIENTPIVLAVTKIDLVSTNEVAGYIEPYKNKFKSIFYVSALTGVGVEDLFITSAKFAKEFVDLVGQRRRSSIGPDIEIKEPPKPKEESCAC